MLISGKKRFYISLSQTNYSIHEEGFLSRLLNITGNIFITQLPNSGEIGL